MDEVHHFGVFVDVICCYGNYWAGKLRRGDCWRLLWLTALIGGFDKMQWFSFGREMRNEKRHMGRLPGRNEMRHIGWLQVRYLRQLQWMNKYATLDDSVFEMLLSEIFLRTNEKHHLEWLQRMNECATLDDLIFEMLHVGGSPLEGTFFEELWCATLDGFVAPLGTALVRHFGWLDFEMLHFGRLSFRRTFFEGFWFSCLMGLMVFLP
ncbi:hypothetical protein JCGZ_15391 [Jatropha curcas]|uniref:Uncharacterized protein n=1 Tax=Jatropha curcas TaxID=180498 RepID=A0A067KI13_JATCU|nr:hypothetical protein JCGZ_15391 [Jatropha curcas]